MGLPHTDPLALAARGRELSGLDYIGLIFSGELPPPPIAQLMGFRGVEFERGRAVFEMTRDRSTTTRSGASTAASL